MELLLSSLPEDFLNIEMFGQLLELDRDDPGFLVEIAKSYILQATNTLNSLETAIESEDLEECSKLGHFLKVYIYIFILRDLQEYWVFLYYNIHVKKFNI